MPIPKILVTAALYGAQAGLNASQRIEGPRIEDLGWTGADPGTPRPRFWGTYRGPKTSFWGEPLKEVKRRRKTKGGKYNDYDYYDTEAVEVACHQIDAVTRIWADGHLIYDMTGAGPAMPFDFGDRAPGSNGEFIRIYLGTDDQEPDPRMQATIEAQLGAGYCPAYRDTSYVQFEDLPVGKFGNRRPQWIIEGVNNAVMAYPYDSTEGASNGERLWNATISPDGQRFFLSVSGNFTLIDLLSRTTIASGDLSTSLGNNGHIGIYLDGSMLGINGGTNLVHMDPDGIVTLVENGYFASGQDSIYVLADADGNEHALTTPSSAIHTHYVDGVAVPSSDYGYTFTVGMYCRKENGEIWAIARNTGPFVTAMNMYLICVVDAAGTWGGGSIYQIAMPNGGDDPAVGIIHVESEGHFACRWNDRIYFIDDTTLAIKSYQDVSFPTWQGGKQWANVPVGATSIWIGGSTSTNVMSEISLVDGSTIRTIDLDDWLNAGGTGATGCLYIPVLHAILSFPTVGTTGTFRYLDRVSGDGVTLGSIASDICQLEGIAAGDRNTSLLTTPVLGYGVSQGDGKEWLAPLLDLYDVDPRPDGFLLDFVPRGGAAGTVIAADGFVRSEEADAPLYSRTRQGGSDIPRQVTIKFRDADAEQQPNSASSPPLSNADGEREMQLDFSNLVLTADNGRDLVTRLHRRMELDAQVATLDLPASQVALQPGDRHLLGFNTGNADHRLHSMQLGADLRIETEWKRDDSSIALLSGTAGAGLDGHIPSEIVVPLPTRGFVVDIPLVRDSDDSTLPILHAAASPYTDGSWPGAVIYRGSGSGVYEEFDDEFATFSSSAGADWGRTNAALPPASPWSWDRGNSLNITLQSGTLTGTTEDAIDADPRLNLLLVGSELIQFVNATLEGDGSYTLSTFKRGRRGTDWAVDGHGAEEIVLLITDAVPETFELAEIGTTGRFKAITLGRTDGSIQDVPLQGNSLKTYSPANVTARRLSNGDWLFDWNRRTRIGAGWGLAEVPIGETSEAYELDLGDGVGTVTKSVSVEGYTWTSAQQTTDLGAPVAAGSLEYEIFQMSAVAGRGFGTSGTA